MSQPNLNEDLNIVSNSDLTITYLDGNLDIIQQLDDEPNDVGGLTAAELKAKFDEAGNIIKTYINGTLIPELLAEEATEAARTAAEEARSNAEAERQSAEEARASAEATRQSNEETRQSNETARVAADNLRASAETAREQAESGRVTAEEARAAAESLRASAEELRASAEQARAAAEQNRVAAEQGRSTAEQSRDIAEQARAAAETGRASAETARDAAEQERVAADIQRTENSEQVIRDSARNAYLSKSYASGQYTISESFDIVAGRTLVSISDIHHDPYVEVGRRYLVTVNDESAEVVATYNGISVFGINIRNNNSNGYDVKNNNDYDVTGSFESIDEAIVGKTAKEYVNEAERQAEKAAAYVNGGHYLDAAQDGSIVPGVVSLGAKDYVQQAKVYAEGGVFDPYPHDSSIDNERHDGAKNLADKAKAFAEGGDYLEWEYLGSGQFSQETKTVEKGAKQYAEAAAGSAAAASASETNAKTSETAAADSAKAAAASATAAEKAGHCVFVATYGETTSVELEAAYQAGKLLVMRKANLTAPLFKRLSENQFMFVAAGLSYLCAYEMWSSSSLIFDPSKHASAHASGGDDPITPESIGAAPATHAENTAIHLPTVTADDNGKFLCVVDGAWAAVSYPSAEGSTF